MTPTHRTLPCVLLPLLCGLACKGKEQDTAAALHEIDGDWSDVAAGGSFSCALVKDGGLPVCWGDDSTGVVSGVPTEGGFIEITAGSGFACARRGDGVPVCWGAADLGETAPNPTPAVQLDAGDHHACSTQADGYVNCWGDGAQGAREVPNQRFEHVSAGFGVSCGATVDEAIVCWGGDPDGTGKPTDPAVGSPAGKFVTVDVGYRMGCAAKDGPGLSCWGETDAFQTLFDEEEHWVELGIGQGEACGRTFEGRAWCAGLTALGETLDGTTWARVRGGGVHGCAVTEGGKLSCWAVAEDPHGAAAGPS